MMPRYQGQKQKKTKSNKKTKKNVQTSKQNDWFKNEDLYTNGEGEKQKTTNNNYDPTRTLVRNS